MAPGCGASIGRLWRSRPGHQSAGDGSAVSETQMREFNRPHHLLASVTSKTGWTRSRVSPAFATAHLTPVPRGPHVIPNARPSRRRRQRAHEAWRFLHKVGEACQRECTVAVPAARSGRSSLRNSPCAPPTRSVAASTLLPRFRYLDQADGRGRTATLKTRDPCSLSELNARKVEFGSAEIVFANELRLSQNFGTGAGCILHLIFFTRLH